MSRFDNTVYKSWADHEPVGPWDGCVICDGDINYKEPCTCTDTEKCVGCQLGYEPCQDPIDPGCVVPTNQKGKQLMPNYVCEHCVERRKTFPPCTYTYDPITDQGTECHCFGCSGAFMDPHEPYPTWVDG